MIAHNLLSGGIICTSIRLALISVHNPYPWDHRQKLLPWRCGIPFQARVLQLCRNPNLAKCGGEAQHLERVGIWSPPGLSNVQSSTARGKTPCIGVFLVSLERSWNVDIENGLALVIWTSAAQVMGKRRAGSQIGSLTPDH
jgi:hypothetical protein